MTLAEVDAGLRDAEGGSGNQKEPWSVGFWGQVRRICAEVVECFREPVCSEAQLGMFEILGLDFICSADGRAIFLEANRDPSWVVDNDTKRGIIPTLVAEMLDIVFRAHGEFLAEGLAHKASEDVARFGGEFRFEVLVD